MKKDFEEKILSFVRDSGKEGTSINQIAKSLKANYPTIYGWVCVLVSQGKLVQKKGRLLRDYKILLGEKA